MQKVGIFEAKTRLSELCLQVEQTGTEYVITRRGKPVARLVGPDTGEAVNAYLKLPITEAVAKWEAECGNTGESDFPDIWKSRRGIRSDPLQE